MGDSSIREHSLIVLCLIILLSFPIFVVSFVPIAQAVPNVSVYPSAITVPVGQDFSINITISSVFGLYAWQFKLKWDAAILDLIGVTEGSFLRSGGATFFTYAVDDTTFDSIVADCTLLGLVPGVNGSGMLAVVSFHAKSAGQCLLDLYEILLLDVAEQPIPCEVFDGYGVFTSEVHDIAITDVSFSPSAVPEGGTIVVDVTALNQGSFTEDFDISVYANLTLIGTQYVSLNGSASTTVSFMWNTAGFAVGDYAIRGLASIVPNEVETMNNNRTADAPATVLLNGHDVAVIKIEPEKSIVGQGFAMKILVTVKNFGTFAETFNTTTTANATVVEAKTTALASGASQIVLFIWNTTTFPMGDYSISANASLVEDEMNTVDNALVDGAVHVGVPGDVDANNLVNMLDLYQIAQNFGAIVSQPAYVPDYDIDSNGILNMLDMYIAATHYGQTES